MHRVGQCVWCWTSSRLGYPPMPDALLYSALKLTFVFREGYISAESLHSIFKSLQVFRIRGLWFAVFLGCKGVEGGDLELHSISKSLHGFGITDLQFSVYSRYLCIFMFHATFTGSFHSNSTAPKTAVVGPVNRLAFFAAFEPSLPCQTFFG